MLNNIVGVGINYRSEFEADILNHLTQIDFLEINTERFFEKPWPDSFSIIKEKIPIVLHGLTASLGTSVEPSFSLYLNQLSMILKEYPHLWFSEHLAITEINGHSLRSLTPMPFNEESIATVVKKIQHIMQYSKQPFLLENITYYYTSPDGYLKEVDFINKILEQSNCFMLLDINNLYVNAINHQYDPYQFIDRLLIDRVIEVHLAGCDRIKQLMVDTHASKIKTAVFDLFQYVCKRTNIRGVIIERDDKLTDFSELLEEVSYVQSLFKKHAF